MNSLKRSVKSLGQPSSRRNRRSLHELPQHGQEHLLGESEDLQHVQTHSIKGGNQKIFSKPRFDPLEFFLLNVKEEELQRIEPAVELYTAPKNNYVRGCEATEGEKA